MNHIFFFKYENDIDVISEGLKNCFREKLYLSRSGWVLKYLPHTLILFCTQNCSNCRHLLCGNWVLHFLQGLTIMAMCSSHKLQLRIRPHPITYQSTGRIYSFIAFFIRFSHTSGETAIHIFYCHFGFLHNKCYLQFTPGLFVHSFTFTAGASSVWKPEIGETRHSPIPGLMSSGCR